MPTKPGTIDEYLATVINPVHRTALEHLRSVLRAAAPGAEECVSYGLAAFRWEGKLLVAFGAAARHCAFYPGSGSTVAAFADQLADYETSKGTIRFQPERPLPDSLVRRIVRARIAENALRGKPGPGGEPRREKAARKRGAGGDGRAKGRA